MVTKVEPISKDDLQYMARTGFFSGFSDEDQDTLNKCINMTTTLWTGKVDDDVLCVFGVVPQTLSTNSAYLWLWTTDRIGDHEFIFVRRSQIVIEKLLENFDYLYGVCDIHADRSIRWLQWLGAVFGASHAGYIQFRIG